MFQRLEKHGIRAKRAKCSFLTKDVEYLDHKIDMIGIRSIADRNEAIQNAKVPDNVTEVGQFLGIVNYYGKFLKELSTTLAPLHNLLRVDVEWVWTPDCDIAVSSIK